MKTLRYRPSTCMSSLQIKSSTFKGNFVAEDGVSAPESSNRTIVLSSPSQAVKESASKKANAQAAVNKHLFFIGNIDISPSMHKST